MHIEKFFLKSFTARAIDWTLFLAIECSTRNQSVGIERHIKKMKTRKYIEDLKRYPEIIIKLKEKYQ
jgi:putative endonuclease